VADASAAGKLMQLFVSAFSSFPFLSRSNRCTRSTCSRRSRSTTSNFITSAGNDRPDDQGPKRENVSLFSALGRLVNDARKSIRPSCSTHHFDDNEMTLTMTFSGSSPPRIYALRVHAGKRNRRVERRRRRGTLPHRPLSFFRPFSPSGVGEERASLARSPAEGEERRGEECLSILQSEADARGASLRRRRPQSRKIHTLTHISTYQRKKSRERREGGSPARVEPTEDAKMASAAASASVRQLKERLCRREQ